MICDWFSRYLAKTELMFKWWIFPFCNMLRSYFWRNFTAYRAEICIQLWCRYIIQSGITWFVLLYQFINSYPHFLWIIFVIFNSIFMISSFLVFNQVVYSISFLHILLSLKPMALSCKWYLFCHILMLVTKMLPLPIIFTHSIVYD